MKRYFLTILWLCLCALTTTVWAQPEPTNVALSDQRAGSVLVFPYYTSGIDANTHDTRIVLTNTGNSQKVVHLLMIDSRDQLCEQQDMFVCLKREMSCELRASIFDPLVNCGYIIAIVVDPSTGCPIRSNVLIGTAFVKMPAGALHASAGAVAGAYTAESFFANTDPNPADCADGKASLRFDGTVYDRVGRWMVTDIQAPSLVPGQTIITAGLSGDVTESLITGAGQLGVGLLYTSTEKVASFSNFLLGQCQAKATITNTTPRVVYQVNGWLARGANFGTIKIPISGGVGLMITPQNTSGYSGIRPLHKLTTNSGVTLDVPTIQPPVDICTS